MDEDEFTVPALLVTDTIIQGLQSGSILASEAGATLPGVNGENQLDFLTQLVDAYVEKKLDSDQVLAGIAAAGLTHDIGQDLAEALWYATIKVSSRAVKGDRDTYEHLADLAKELLKKSKVTRLQLLAVGEADLLDALGLTKFSMTARDKRTLTSMYYKQDKYNLLREQNEGYGKLIAELMSGGPLQSEHLPALAQQIKSHIGTFNLDPNRVCDLVLDAAEAELALHLQGQEQQSPVAVPVWLQLMSLFSTDAPLLMLARKFLHYQHDRTKITGDETDEELSGPPPSSLFMLAACMIKCGQVTLEQVLPYLGPTDELQEQYKKARSQLDEEVAELARANLLAGSVASDKMDKLAGKGGLDEVAKARGITDRYDEGPGGGYDRRGGGGMGGQGGMGPPPHRGMQQGMQGYPPGMNGNWPRGMAPGQPGMGQFGGPYGAMPGYGMPPGHFQGGAGMGGQGMSGGMAQPGAPSGGARGSGGGQAGPAAAAAAAPAQQYNIMPAADLVLDARQYDKQLLDPKSGQLQLLGALMQVEAWEAAVLMLQWLQDVLGLDPASDRSVAAAISSRVRVLLQPVHSKLYPQGPSNGNVLERFAERPSSARDKDREGKLLVFSAEQRSAQPFAPALDPAVYQLMCFLGPYVYRDAVLMVMLLKVLRHELLFYGGMLQGQADKDAVDKVCDVLSGALLPALTQHSSNMGLANMVWDAMAHMPFAYRAEVYRKSILAVAARPVVNAAAQVAIKAFKAWKGRIALPDKKDLKLYKAVVKGQQRLIAKLTHAAPLQVCGEIVGWAMNTPSQVESLSEVVKMHNRLSCDALTYQALFLWDRLGHPKIKDDGTSEMENVQGLCDLVGRAGLAHPWSSFDMGVVLQYLASTLHEGESEAILMLKRVLTWMSGIDGPAGADPSNYLSLCLGPYVSDYRKRDEKREEQIRLDKLRAKGRRVLAQLLTSPHDQPKLQLLVPLIVTMSQHLDWTIYTIHTQHVKLVAEMHDKVSHATQQYLMTLEQFLKDEEVSLKELAERLPAVHELIREYKVAPGIAWSLWRPIFRALEPALAARRVLRQQQPPENEQEAAQRKAADASAALEWAAAASGDGSVAAGGGGDGEEGEVEEGEAMQGQEGPGADKAPEIIAAAEKKAAEQGLPVDLPALLASVDSLGPEMFEHLTPELYLAFWSMELPDIYFANEEYASSVATIDNALTKYPEEIRKHTNQVRELQARLKMARGFDAERIQKDLTGAETIIETNTNLLNYAKAFDKPVKAERDAAAARYALGIKRLQAEKHLYVRDAKSIHAKLHAFIKYCLLPRLTRSAADAVYCHFFCLKLHELDVPMWPAGFFWDDAIMCLTNIIPTVTEREAGYLAMFLGLALLKIQGWYDNKELFDAECDKQTMRQSSILTTRLNHVQFTKLFKKWQGGLHKSLTGCLQDPDQYLQRRNAIVIITKLTQANPSDSAPPMFPFYKSHFTEICKLLQDIGEKEKKPDVRTMAANSFVHLSRRGDNCKDIPGGGRIAQLNKPSGNRGPAAAGGRGGGGATGGAVKPPASPLRPQQQEQQQRAGGGGSRPTTPPSASATAGGGGGGGGGGSSTTAAAAGGDKAGGGPKAVRKAPAAGGANVLKKAVQEAAAGTQPAAAAAAAGGKPGQRPLSGGGGEDEPPTKRARTAVPAQGKGEGPTSAAAGAAAGGGDREGRETGKGEEGRGGSKQQQQGGGGGSGSRPSSRPPSGSDRVAAVAAAERGGGGNSSRAASPGSAAASPARGAGGDRGGGGGGGDRGGSRMGTHHSKEGGEREHHGSRDHTPQRHGDHSDEPHGKAAAAAGAGVEERKEGKRDRSRDGGRERGHEKEKERDGSKDRTRDGSRGRHHSPEHKRGGGSAAAAEEGKDSGKKEKRGGKGRKSDKEGAKKEARPAEEPREDSHDSKRRRLNDAPAAATDGASSREQRQQHGSADGGRDRSEANGHRASGTAAAGGGGGGGGARGRGGEQQQGDAKEGREQRGRDKDGDKQDRKGREQDGEQQPRHARISFPGADEGSKGSEKPPPRQAGRKR